MEVLLAQRLHRLAVFPLWVPLILLLLLLLEPILSTSAFPPIVTDDSPFETWQPHVNKVAEEALLSINAQLRAESMGQQQETATSLTQARQLLRPRSPVELALVEMEGVRLADTLLFTATAEVEHPAMMALMPGHRRTSLDLAYLQPPEVWNFLWRLHSPSAGSGALIPLPHPDAQPAFPVVEVEGPLEFWFSEKVNQAEFWLPNRAEVEPFQRLTVHAGVRVQLSGLKQLRLRNDVYLDEDGEMDKEENDEMPQLEAHPLSPSSLRVITSEPGMRFKAKMTKRHTVELSSSLPSSSSSSSSSHSLMKTEGTVGSHGEDGLLLSADNLVKAVRFAVSSASGVDGGLQARRIVAGKIEAVRVLLVPMQVRESETGAISRWEAVMVTDAKDKTMPLSLQQLITSQDLNMVSVDEYSHLMNATSPIPSLMINLSNRGAE
ncbi:hypothetical protein QOT17_003436 [Balamuthia mandrillaris]